MIAGHAHHEDDTDNSDKQGMAMLGAASNMTLKMFVRENKVSYDISLLGGLITMRSIIDRNARTLTMLLPTHSAMVMDLRAMDSMRGRIEDSMKVACRNWTFVAETPAGSVFWMLSSAASHGLHRPNEK